MRSGEIRAVARKILSGKWAMAILVTFIAGILGAALVGSFNLSFNIDEEWVETLPAALRRLALVYLAFAASVGGILGTIQFIFGGVLKLGYCRYLLKLHDGEDADIKDLFSQLKTRFADGFLLSLLSSIYIFLWTLLFIIPGIIATYRYAMAPFLMLENPGMKANDAIRASSDLMQGEKVRLFCLELSFIGWAFLCIFTMGIGTLWLNPYQNMSRAVFYRDLCPRSNIVDGETVIPESNPEVL